MKNKTEQIAFNQELYCYMDVDSEEQYWPIDDICEILELSDVDQALAELEPDQITICPIETDTESPEAKETKFIDHSGVLTLMMQSQASIAKKFRRWISRDVLVEVLSPFGAMHEIDMSIKEELISKWLLPWWCH